MANLLHRLARLYHIQSEYRDGLGQLRKAPPEAILSVLKALDAPVGALGDVPDALRQRREALWHRSLEPVHVAWQNQPLIIPVRLPIGLAEASAAFEILLENGEHLDGDCQEVTGRRPLFKRVEGASYVVRRLLPRCALPLGYHRLRLRIGDHQLESALFSAPLQAYTPGQREGQRWGVFCPLYALKSALNWGAGDYSDLAALARFVAGLKGNAVGTLPMLASFLDEPFNPSPYAPVSRLYWNEFYLDVTRIPEFTECPKTQAMAASEAFREELARRRGDSLVDYRRVMALKRRVIEELLVFLMSRSNTRRERFESYIAARPDLRTYAAFRAKVEIERCTWQHWESSARDGVIAPDRRLESAKMYHLFVQWQCDEQTSWLKKDTQLNGARLYLDFPLGVNRDGYDVWRE
ncbi:MAG TPA: 4-alpha-glucanotransferase, partial [Terriglobales bacterium]|nr:4-alpha-glucanotransferase [Terriglobales bacterium]